MCDVMLISIILIPDFCGQVDASHPMRPRAVVVENNDEVLGSGAEIPDVDPPAGRRSVSLGRRAEGRLRRVELIDGRSANELPRPLSLFLSGAIPAEGILQP